MKIKVYRSPAEPFSDQQPRFQNIDWVTTPPQEDFYLELLGEQIVLQKKNGDEKPLVVDLQGEWNKWKEQRISPKTDLLARACAVKPQVSILDMTMGMAVDSLKLVYFGAQVTATEKHPFLYALVNDALMRSDMSLSLRVEWVNGCEYAREHYQRFDSFYLDPMFHLAKRTALPKKKMQFLSDIIGSNKDEEFLETVQFLLGQRKRVVVKRHPDATPFGGMKPKTIYAGKAVRFEVF